MQGYGPGYNSTNHPNNLNGTGMATGGWSNGWNGNTAGFPPNMNRPNGARVYVNGRAEAENYPMPPGANEITLWDSNGGRVYIKAYDNNGYPRVVEDYDLITHVDPAPPEYVTKEDIRAILDEMLSNRAMSAQKNYSTRNDKNGRGSRNDEPNG